jgi:hypothetical protein
MRDVYTTSTGVMAEREHGDATKRIQFLYSKNLESELRVRFEILLKEYGVAQISPPIFSDYARRALQETWTLEIKMIAHQGAVQQYLDEMLESLEQRAINVSLGALRKINGGHLPGDP